MALMLFVWLIVGGGVINVAIHSLMAALHLLQLGCHHYPLPAALITGVFL
ncbi:hypothetical protein MJ561_20305 [Klebsiella pneumoniae]|nr:hypothetical protein MJ561_20305 [Klebsiella pneumoniae]